MKRFVFFKTEESFSLLLSIVFREKQNTTVKENHSQTDVILFLQDFFSFSISVTRTVCIHACLFVLCVGVFTH